MANRKIIDESQREQLNALPIVAPDGDEEQHFFVCGECGQRVDYRRLGDVLYHDTPEHDPLPARPSMPRVRFIAPMSPILVETPPDGPAWAHEIKYDGYRTQIHLRDGQGWAFTRNGYDWSERYALLIAAALRLPCETAVIDGEVIVPDADGGSDFHALRGAIMHTPERLVMIAFDLMELDGQDLRGHPLERRRQLLRKLLGPNDPYSPLHYSDDIVGAGASLFALVETRGLEGVVSKRLGSRYRSGPSDAWCKAKCYMEEELVVIGTERGTGAPVALLAREEDGGLNYAGGAMITLRQAERDRFWRAVDALRMPDAPIAMAKRRDATWVRPEMVVRVRTLRGEEKLRHATLLGITRLPEGQS